MLGEGSSYGINLRKRPGDLIDIISLGEDPDRCSIMIALKPTDDPIPSGDAKVKILMRVCKKDIYFDEDFYTGTCQGSVI